MKFSLNQSSTGEWFPFFTSRIKTDGTIEYDEPEKDAGKVCIRITDPVTLETVQAQTRTRKVDFVLNTLSRKMERVVSIDQTPEQAKKERELLWDFAVVDWEKNKFFDEEGLEIVCNPENKMKMMSNLQFALFVGRCLELINSALSEAGKVKEKN